MDFQLKEIIIILIIMTVTIIYSVYSIIPDNPGIEENHTGTNDWINLTHIQDMNDMDKYQTAIEEKRPEICELIKPDELRYRCKAVSTGDLQHCFENKDVNLINQCKSRFYYYRAINNNDPKICLKIENKRLHDSCLIKFSDDETHSWVCQEIKEDKKRSNCMASKTA